MTILRCLDCGNTFEEGDAPRRTETDGYEFWGEVGTVKYQILYCPFCGSDEVYDELEADEQFGDE